MKIGIFASPRHSVPSSESQHNVAWDMAGFLADGLVDLGRHDVSLFASKGSKTKAKLVHVDINPLDQIRESVTIAQYRQKVGEAELALFKSAVEQAKHERFDLIHIHEPTEYFLDLVRELGGTIPFVFTIHEPILSNRIEKLEALGKLPNCSLVTISNAQRDGFTTIPFAETVYYGLPLSEFAVGPGSPYQFMVAGRIAPEKGFEDAIAAAVHIGSPLVIAGKVVQSLLGTNSYFREKIEPRMYDTLLTLKEFLSRDQLISLYGSSKALLYPTKWEEPFAMVMLEAMACGTPIVGYNRGCVPEVVVDGVTGFIVDPDLSDRPGRGSWIIKKTGVEGLAEAMGRISEIKRERCRTHIEDHFSVKKMAESYETLYKKILGTK
jgi:glycosyltransferase involved in cell wall biosynthesis